MEVSEMHFKRFFLLILAFLFLFIGLGYTTIDFTGIWDSDFGILDLKQTGSKVEGTYSGLNGMIEGKIDGSRLQFTWKDPVYGEGWGVFDLVENENRIVGSWGMKGDNNPKGQWNAIRHTEPVFEGTPTYWDLEETVTYLNEGNSVKVGTVKGTAILYFSENKVSGKCQGTLTSKFGDQTMSTDVFNYLSGTKNGDVMNLIWQNPTDGSRGTMILKKDKDQWKGKWQIPNSPDGSGGNTFLTPSSPQDKTSSSGMNYINQTEKKNNLLLGDQSLKKGFELFAHLKYQEAETEYQKAQHYFELADQSDKLAQVYLRFGDLYSQTGRYEPALDYYQKAITMAGKEDTTTIMLAKSGIALVKIALGLNLEVDKTSANETVEPANRLIATKYKLYEADPVTARQIYNKFMKEEPRAVNLDFEVFDLIDLANIEQIMAINCLKEKELDDCITHYQHQNTIWEKLSTKPLYGLYYNTEINIAKVDTSLALVYNRKGDFKTAAAYFQKAIELEERNQVPEIWSTYYLYAESYSNQPGMDKELVITYYEKSINALEVINKQLTQDETLKPFMETNSNPYQSYIHYLVNLNQPDYNRRALEIAELSRSRAFMELIAQRFYGPEFTEQKQKITPADFFQIQQTSTRLNASILEYFILDSPAAAFQKQLIIWLINPDGKLYMQTVSLANIDFDSMLNTCYHGLFTRNIVSLTSQSKESEFKLDSGKLYQILFPAEIQAYLPQKEGARLILVPHKDLGLIPFMALRDSKGKYLIERYCCQQVPGIGVLLRTNEIKAIRLANKQNLKFTPDSILLYGNPLPDGKDALPDSEAEVQSIAKIFHVNAQIGSAASEYQFKKAALNKTVIHLSTHGELNLSQPLESNIRLAPGQGENGLLTAEEILQMKFNADLVVLSACQTGLGKVSGDGIEGLIRSFMVSGATSVVVSLWSVKDEPTKELMVAFYQNLAKGMTKAEALRKAQLYVKSHQQWEKPINWAAFVLYGEGD
jgi:CHAT domain-containing protein/Tfp pilus assembly protein PilF